MAERFVKLDPDIIRSPLFDDTAILKLWLYIICKKSYSEMNCMVGSIVVPVRVNQLVCGRRALAEAIGENESKVYRSLKILKRLGLIELEPHSKYTILTVLHDSVLPKRSSLDEQ